MLFAVGFETLVFRPTAWRIAVEFETLVFRPTAWRIPAQGERFATPWVNIAGTAPFQGAIIVATYPGRRCACPGLVSDRPSA